MTGGPVRAAALAVVVAAAAGVLLLRGELMTVHRPSAPGSVTEVVLVARTQRSPAVLAGLTGGLVESCRVLVHASAVSTPLREVAPGRFTYRLTPALDEFDRRELKGCLQDLRQEGVLVDVQRMRSTGGAD